MSKKRISTLLQMILAVSAAATCFYLYRNSRQAETVSQLDFAISQIDPVLDAKTPLLMPTAPVQLTSLPPLPSKLADAKHGDADKDGAKAETQSHHESSADAVSSDSKPLTQTSIGNSPNSNAKSNSNPTPIPTAGLVSNSAQDLASFKRTAIASESHLTFQSSGPGWKKNRFFRTKPAVELAPAAQNSPSAFVSHQEAIDNGNDDFELSLNSPETESARSVVQENRTTPFASSDSVPNRATPLRHGQLELPAAPLSNRVFEPTKAIRQMAQQPATSTDSTFEPGQFPIMEISSTQNEGRRAKPPTQNEMFSGTTLDRSRLPESVMHKAVEHIEYGKSLARRSSTFAARQEFNNALKLLAQAADAQAGGDQHSAALAKAMIAIREAGDFYAGNGESYSVDRVQQVIATHNTKAFSPELAERMMPIEAMQRYFSYAQKNLVIAAGRNVVAAEAFYCLGKLHSRMAAKPGEAPLGSVKSITYHRAAIASDEGHYQSANELAALLARAGQLPEAKELLISSLRIRSTPVAWKNLEAVHRRLGEADLAQLASEEYQLALQQPSTGSGNQIQWVEPNEFNGGGSPEARTNVARRPQQMQQQQAPPKPTQPWTARLPQIKLPKMPSNQGQPAKGFAWPTQSKIR